MRAVTHLRRALVLVPFLASSAAADTTPQALPFSQDWSNTGLITADDDWSGVPGITGYKDDLSGSTGGVDPRTIVAPGVTEDVNTDETNPDTFNTGGVTEFEIANPVVALSGSGTADAPHIVLTLNTTGVASVRIRYNLRDIDASSADNSVQQFALQYRIGTTGDFTDVPEGYVADATTGPSEATLVTPVNVVLPAAVGNQPVVQIRIMTTNAVGNDERVGIDDIQVTDATTSPTATGAADPTSATRGTAVTLTATVTPGEAPTSTGITVTCDLTGIGGSATQALSDDGTTGGDTTADDNIFTFATTVDASAAAGAKTLPCTVTDAETRSSTFDIAFTVEAVCGDGIVEGTETCDDMGTTAGDGCSDTCMEEPGYTCTGMPSVCTDDDECADMTDNCDPLAACANTAGSFTCTCPTGYAGDGTTDGTGCTDIDECTDMTDTCDENASCTNGDGDFTCACNAGYDGDGMTCADVDECADGTDDCDENATCTNTDGGFTCECAAGYSGDGTTCMPDCGDGIVTAPEACDDGDMTDGDGCSANCTVETGYTCTGEPSTCTPDDDGNGGGNNNGDDDGGGCCSSSSHPGSALLLAMFVMVGLRRRQRR